MKTIDSALKQTLVIQPLSSATSSRVSSSLAANRLRHTQTTTPRPGIITTDLNRIKDRVIDKSDMGFIRAKAHLLKTRWMDMNSLVTPNDIVEGYGKASLECEHWEKSYYLAGQYYLKLYDNSRRFKNRTPIVA